MVLRATTNLPHLLGHEGCGRVIDVGEGVTTVKIGDLVVLHWRKVQVLMPFCKV